MVNLLTAQTLPVSKPVSNASKSVPTPRLFACFERSELCFFLVESSSFTETSQFITRKWEVVDQAWFDHVRGVLERSIDNPKSLERLFAAVDLYDRAREMIQRFAHTGRGGVRGGGGDQVKTDGDQVQQPDANWKEIEQTERRVRQFRESRGIDLETDLWTLAEREAGRTGDESPAAMGAPKLTPEILAGILAELPAVGSVVDLPQRLESFGGFIPPGPATVVAANLDHFGGGFVSLERGGVLVANGVAWPLQRA